MIEILSFLHIGNSTLLSFVEVSSKHFFVAGFSETIVIIKSAITIKSKNKMIIFFLSWVFETFCFPSVIPKHKMEISL